MDFRRRVPDAPPVVSLEAQLGPWLACGLPAELPVLRLNAVHPLRGPAVQAVYATGTVEATVMMPIAPCVSRGTMPSPARERCVTISASFRSDMMAINGAAA